MSDAIKLEMFNDAYALAVKAEKAGDIAAAKQYFMRAATIMDELAKSSAPPLDKTRADRAEKLRFIAENLTEKVSASSVSDDPTADGNNEYKFFNPSSLGEKIRFDDIIGLDEAKSAMRRLLTDPLKHPEVYSKYGLKAGGFILLEGPPGTGKTTFAKAAACELGVPFAEINANALVDSYIGKTGKNIDLLFAEARRYAQSAKLPVVMFIDELDYLAQKRGGENKTAAEAVPALIKQMDGFSTGCDNLVLIAATNLVEALDPAILSRFRNVINIPLPTRSERKEIFAQKLKVLSPSDFSSVDLDKAAEITDGFSGRDIAQTALDIKNVLAERDAGIRQPDKPLSELLSEFVYRRRRKS